MSTRKLPVPKKTETSHIAKATARRIVANGEAKRAACTSAGLAMRSTATHGGVDVGRAETRARRAIKPRNVSNMGYRRRIFGYSSGGTMTPRLSCLSGIRRLFCLVLRFFLVLRFLLVLRFFLVLRFLLVPKHNLHRAFASLHLEGLPDFGA